MVSDLWVDIVIERIKYYFPVVLFTVNSRYYGHPRDRELVS